MIVYCLRYDTCLQRDQCDTKTFTLHCTKNCVVVCVVAVVATVVVVAVTVKQNDDGDVADELNSLLRLIILDTKMLSLI